MFSNYIILTMGLANLERLEQYSKSYYAFIIIIYDALEKEEPSKKHKSICRGGERTSYTTCIYPVTTTHLHDLNMLNSIHIF